MRNTMPKTLVVQMFIRDSINKQSYRLFERNFRSTAKAKKIANEWLNNCSPTEDRQAAIILTKTLWVKTVEKGTVTPAPRAQKDAPCGN